MALDLEAIQERYLAVAEQTGDWRAWAARLGRSQQDVPGLVMEVEALRAELKWVRSIITLHQQNGCGRVLAELGESRGGDRPPYEEKPS